eukprot:TRINITY_DN66483_c8_g4_i2.p2 TRINITY_DN66483_c8_g4~~TRINITY_DN66483_c8_g4_i2.p2  ORF type:complete len:173 (+),score=44.22 TRINITY_DN66483_c8_g4_i2:1097-1615(+)
MKNVRDLGRKQFTARVTHMKAEKAVARLPKPTPVAQHAHVQQQQQQQQQQGNQRGAPYPGGSPPAASRNPSSGPYSPPSSNVINPPFAGVHAGGAAVKSGGEYRNPFPTAGFVPPQGQQQQHAQPVAHNHNPPQPAGHRGGPLGAYVPPQYANTPPHVGYHPAPAPTPGGRR